MTYIAKKYPINVQDFLPIIKKLPILHQGSNRSKNVTINGNYIAQKNFHANSGFILRNHAVPSKPSSNFSNIFRSKSNPKEYNGKHLGCSKNLIKKIINNPYLPIKESSKSSIRNIKHTPNVVGVIFH